MASDVSPPEAVVQYFDYLADDQFRKAANQFTEDCVYCHPPNFQNEVVVRGREELFEYFSEERGSKEIDHEFERVMNSDSGCGLVGRLTGGGIDGEDYFIGYAELEDDKISYYIAGLLMGSVK
jgi:hypothetical protein